VKQLSAAIVLFLACAACSVVGVASHGAADPAGLIGSWVLTQGTGPDGEVPIVEGYRITLEIEGAEVGGTSACNHYFGRIAVTGNALRIDQLGGTEMACQPDVMASESSYWVALGAVTRWARDGDRLVLSGPNASLTYELLQPVPDAAMVDTVWVLDTLISGDAASSVETRATLELRSDRTFAGSTGCREFTGRYVISGDQVVVTDLAMAGECSAELASQDSHVVTVLEGGFTVQVAGNRLTLGSSGNEGLSYTAETE
jgi:heat shock protein HslJ